MTTQRRQRYARKGGSPVIGLVCAPAPKRSWQVERANLIEGQSCVAVELFVNTHAQQSLDQLFVENLCEHPCTDESLHRFSLSHTQYARNHVSLAKVLSTAGVGASNCKAAPHQLSVEDLAS